MNSFSTSYRHLFAGDYPQAIDRVMIGAGQSLTAGAVLGKKTPTAGAKAVYSFALSAFTAPSAGTKTKLSFALSALTAGTGTVTLAVSDGASVNLSYPVTTTSGSTIDGILASLAALANADASCPFAVTADADTDKLVLEADVIGTAANDYVVTLTAATVVLTIGAKTVVTAGTAADAEGSVTLAVSDGASVNLSYPVTTSSVSTIDGILSSLAALANADASCPFAVTADTDADKLVLEANTVGTWPADYTVTLSKTDVTLTIGAKTVVTAGVDFSKGEFFLVDSSKGDGTQNPVAVLMDDTETPAGAAASASVAYTGDVDSAELSFGGTDTVATHIDAMRAHCLFVRNTIPVSGV